MQARRGSPESVPAGALTRINIISPVICEMRQSYLRNSGKDRRVIRIERHVDAGSSDERV